MNAKIDTKAANELRLFIKEMRWAAYHLEQFYNIVKPEEAPVITMPANQLDIFDAIGKEDDGNL